MLTLIERTRLHLSQPYTLGWDWTAEALIEELTAQLQDAGLPARLREVYTSLKLDLLLGCEDEAALEEADVVVEATASLPTTGMLASGKPKPVLRTKAASTPLPKPVLKSQSPEEWAFKMGTLCTSTTTAPRWSSLATNKVLDWIATATQDDRANGYSRLNECFRLGTYCKVGTDFRLVHSSNDWRVGARLATTPL